MADYETIRLDHADGVTVLTLDRPRRRNALNPTMFVELTRAVAAIAAHPGCRAVVVHGAGGQFCAGADLHEGFGRPADAPGLPNAGSGRPRGDPFSALHDCPIPTFAAVEGAAIGIGLSLALACDVVVVSRSARLELAQVRLGLVPDGGVSWSLPRLVGPQQAAWLSLSGAAVSGAEAAGIGLALECTDDGGALARALERARDVARAPRPVLERVKRVLREGMAGPWDAAAAAERAALVEAYRSPEFAEALDRARRARGGAASGEETGGPAAKA